MYRLPNSRSALSLLTILACLGGCGNIHTVRSFMTPYGEPTEGDRARIRVITNGMIRAVPNSACVDWRLPSAGVMVTPDKGFAHLNDRVLSMPRGRISQALTTERALAVSELYIPAGKPITFFYLLNEKSSGDNTPECALARSFVPRANTEYELWTDRAFGQCFLEVDAIGSEGKPAEPIRIELDNAKFCRITDNI